MKKTDIALIIIIISISAGLSYWIAHATMGKTNEKPIVVRTIEDIKVDEVKVDESVFSKDAINPTVEATITGQDLTSFIDGNESTTPDTTENQNQSADDVQLPSGEGETSPGEG